MPSPAKKSAASTPKSAAKPIAGKPLAKSEPKNEAPAKPAAAKPAAAKPSPTERMKMIAEAAYYLAQKRGFSGGNEMTDWMAAEQQVDGLIAKRG